MHKYMQKYKLMDQNIENFRNNNIITSIKKDRIKKKQIQKKNIFRIIIII